MVRELDELVSFSLWPSRRGPTVRSQATAPESHHLGTMAFVMFERISVNHEVIGGVPCIRGTRIPVATVVGMVAQGMTKEEILSKFAQLAGEDIQEALRYAAAAVDERQGPLTGFSRAIYSVR